MRMEMTYDGALVMPSSYAVMDEDEMMYVDGGWSTYRGWNGWAKVSTMMASVGTWCVSGYKLAGVAGGIATTGSSLCFSLGGAQVAMVAVAITLMKTRGAFQAKNVGFWSWSADLVRAA